MELFKHCLDNVLSCLYNIFSAINKIEAYTAIGD